MANRITLDSLPNLEVLRSLAARDRVYGDSYYVNAPGTRFWFNSNAIAPHDGVLTVAPADTVGPGRWLRCCGFIDVSLPIDWTMPDGAVLLTVPPGARLRLLNTYLEITETFLGSSSPTVALSSTHTGMTALGAIAGGSTGNALKNLTVGIRPGVIGNALSTVQGLHDAMLVETDQINFRRGGGPLTAGRGFYHLTVNLLVHPGAA